MSIRHDGSVLINTPCASTAVARTFWAVVLALVLVACGADGNAADHDDIATPLPNPLPGVAAAVDVLRGSIVIRQPVDLAEVDGEAIRAVYRTVSGVDGGARDVSGVFVVPSGQPPTGGWPLISMAHGTTGIAQDCGPSLDPDLMGFLPTVRDLVVHGYAVALTDYEGLGGDGIHPYLEPRTAAFNVIDAARAIRNIFPGISQRWVALGNSQGGQAVWATGEVVANDADELELVGVAALSPAANLTPLAQRAAESRLTPDQRAVLPMVVAGLERSDPGLRIRNLISAQVRAEGGAAFACHSAASPAVDLRWSDRDDVDAFRDALRKIALPQQRPSAPMLVVNGLADNTIAAPWVADAVRGACDLGGRIQHVEVDGAGHGDLGASSYRILYEWLHDRFAAVPAPSNCGQQAQQVDLG